VTLIALASIKGSPGVTTAATALAASWPEGRRVLLVEADPFGGDLAPRYATAPTGGLSSLFAAARRTLVPEDVWAHVDHLPGGLPVLFGLAGMHQATANEKAWPAVADALGALDADVVVDVGRLLPNLGGGVREVLARADVLVILCQSTLEAIVHLREALPGLSAELQNWRLLVVPTGTTQFSAADIARTLQVEVLQPLPGDPAAAAALANRRATKRLDRTRLLRWASDTIGTLGVEGSATEFDALEVSESEVGTGSADTGQTEGRASADVPPPTGSTDLHQPMEVFDPTEGAELAGATFGSKWETSR
jgi:MinD-like ATPase involved in chromosome partitioning or flagellar assembly